MDSTKQISIVVTHRILDDDICHLSALNSRDIKEFTYYPYELIFVDNASEDKYIKWLADTPDIYLRNKYNRGNAMAWDQGLAIANNDIIILMDNDCIPTAEAWDKDLVDKLSELQIGITFPYSVVGDELDKLHSGFPIEYKGRRDGFCFAAKRKTYLDAGKFLEDQPFKLGYYEDDWFQHRVQYRLGLKLTACPTSRVWHKGQATSKKMWSDEFAQGIEDNKKWYESKVNGQNPFLV